MNYQMNWFSYGATSAAPKSSDFGLIVTANNTFDAPQRSVTAYGVQGLNGDVVIDNGKWNNTTISYTVHALRVTNETMNRIRAWLCVTTGYQRIFDSYDSAIFREGYFSGNISWIMTQLKKCGTATLTFIVKPQRFEVSTSTESSGINIPSSGLSYRKDGDYLDAYPLIKLSGFSRALVYTDGLSFYVQYGSTRYQVTGSFIGISTSESLPTTSELYYDLDTMQCYTKYADGTIRNWQILVQTFDGSDYDDTFEKIAIKPNTQYTIRAIISGVDSITCTAKIFGRWSII